MNLLSPSVLIPALGLAGVAFMIFAESGLFFGFFLPGDSLLFAAGLFASAGYLPLVPLIIICIICAIAGDAVGYWTGRKLGPRIFSKEDSFFFSNAHVARAEAFYAKHGSRTIVLARFVPIVRTFAPIVAGVARMNYKTFFSYNAWGAVVWVSLMTLLGYFVGSKIPNAKDYLLFITIGIIALSFVPVLISYFNKKS